LESSGQKPGMILAACDPMQSIAQSDFEKVLAVHYPSVFRVARHLYASPESAMMLTDHTLRLALDRSRKLPVPGDIRGWLLAILLHQFLEVRSRLVAGMTPRKSSCCDSMISPRAGTRVEARRA
jgi:hypothetical protein